MIQSQDLVVQLEVKAVCDEVLAVRTSEALCGALEATPPPPGTRIEVISFWPGALPAAVNAGWPTRLIVASPYTPAALAEWAVGHGVAGVILEAPFWSARHVDVWRGAGLSLMSGVCNDVDIARCVMAFEPEAFSSGRPHELRTELAASPQR